MSKAALLCMLVASAALAQAPFANLYWEASDGGAWTRSQITTTQQNVQIRLVGEWGGVGAVSFGEAVFDATVSAAREGDVAINPVRQGLFNWNPQTLAVSQFGNIIKIDDHRDLDFPGLGTRGVDCVQVHPGFGNPVDQSNPAILFAYRLSMADIPGTRVVSSIPLLIDATGANVLLWSGGGVLRATAPVFGVDVTYVPTPGCLALLTPASTLLVRRRR